MSDSRQTALDHDDIRNSIRDPIVQDEPTATIGSITGEPGSTVPAWFRVQPVRLGAAKPAEDAGATPQNVGAPIWGYILGPEVPSLGDIVSLRLIGGRWVGNFGGGLDVCHFQCSGHTLPKVDLTLSWTSTAGDGTARLINTDAFWAATNFIESGGFRYGAVVSCSGNNLYLTISKYTTAGAFVGQYSAGSPDITEDGGELTIEWTTPSGLIIPEGTWTATTDEDGRCCGKFTVAGCQAEETEVRAYDKDDELMWTATSVGGRVSKMWNGSIKRIEVDSPDYRLLPIDKAFPDGIACNSITNLYFAPISGYQCCICDRPLPKRIYVTTPDGTFPTDINPAITTANSCGYTPICYVKTVPNGCVVVNQAPFGCRAIDQDTPQPTPVSIAVSVVRQADGGFKARVLVSALIWGSTGPDAFCRWLAPFYFVSLADCASVPECRRICGGLGQPITANPFLTGWSNEQAMTNCEVASSFTLSSNTLLDPPFTSLSVSV